MNFGILITDVTSRFGVVSRRAAKRLAADTGKRMIDKARELGRSLTKAEMEEVIAQTLPKKCRPKIITARQEVAPFLKNSGATEEQIQLLLSNPEAAAMCVSNGGNKQPIFVPLGKIPTDYEISLTAHEIEHAIERNNRASGIASRKLNALLTKTLKYYDKRFGKQSFAKLINLSTKLNFDHQIIQKLLQGNNGTMNRFARGLDHQENVLNAAATEIGLARVNGMSSADEFEQKVLDILRQNYASADRSNSHGLIRFSTLDSLFQAERPAYSVQAEVERYALGLGEGQMPKAKGTEILYKAAQKANRKENFRYIFNKMFGKLKAPNQYTTEKDLYKLFTSKEDKNLVKEMVKDMSLPEKINLFNTIKDNPQSIHNIKAFWEATSDMPNGGYKYLVNYIADIKPELLQNPNFLKIVRISEERPVYGEVLKGIAELSDSEIEKFAAIADIKGADGVYKYKNLFWAVKRPDFEKLKAFADIEVAGRGNPYMYTVTDVASLPPDRIDYFLTKAQNAAKEGKDISEEIQREADELVFDYIKRDLKSKTLAIV